MVREINSMETLKTIVDGNTFVVVDFFTPGCPPCKKLAPFIEVIDKHYTQITVLKVNCEAMSLDYKFVNFECYLCSRHLYKYLLFNNYFNPSTDHVIDNLC